jgi:multiple sugar transport system substrate-binding protein
MIRIRHRLTLLSTIVLLFLVVSLGLLTGCAPKKVATDHIVLEMWIMPNSQEPVADLESVIAAFEKKHPKIKVKITSLDWGSAWQKITTAARSSFSLDTSVTSLLEVLHA